MTKEVIVAMTTDESAGRRIYPAPDTKEQRRLPVLVAFIKPFRLVTSHLDDRPWSATIAEINGRSWDYVRLHEVVGGLDVRLPPPFHAVVGFDGALALPVVPATRPVEAATIIYNRLLAALLLGGIYCEAIRVADVQRGLILDWQYIRVVDNAATFEAQFHEAARTRHASSLQAISFFKPRTIKFSECHEAHAVGAKILDDLPALSPDLLLRGVTSLAERDWSAALSNISICIEQLTSHLWDLHIVDKADQALIPGRRRQLQDFRTWTVATRQELLFQLGHLGSGVMQALFAARKARNDLAHRGMQVTETSAWEGFGAMRDLLELTAGRTTGLSTIDLRDHAVSEPFHRTQPKGSPTHWLEMPNLPGEAEINRELDGE